MKEVIYKKVDNIIYVRPIGDPPESSSKQTPADKENLKRLAQMKANMGIDLNFGDDYDNKQREL